MLENQISVGIFRRFNVSSFQKPLKLHQSISSLICECICAYTSTHAMCVCVDVKGQLLGVISAIWVLGIQFRSSRVVAGVFKPPARPSHHT